MLHGVRGSRAEGAAMHMCSSQELFMLLVLDTFEGLRLGSGPLR